MPYIGFGNNPGNGYIFVPGFHHLIKGAVAEMIQLEPELVKWVSRNIKAHHIFFILKLFYITPLF